MITPSMNLFIRIGAAVLLAGVIVSTWYVVVFRNSISDATTLTSEPSVSESASSDAASNNSTSIDASPLTISEVGYELRAGWTLDTTNQQSDDVVFLNRPDPIVGTSESEMLNANEGFIRIALVRKTDDDYSRLIPLLTSGDLLNKKSTLEDPYESLVLSQDDLVLTSLKGRIYTHTNVVSGQQLDTRVTGVLKYVTGVLLHVKAGYGRGADADKLRQEIFSILHSLSS